MGRILCRRKEELGRIWQLGKICELGRIWKLGRILQRKKVGNKDLRSCGSWGGFFQELGRIGEFGRSGEDSAEETKGVGEDFGVSVGLRIGKDSVGGKKKKVGS